MDSREALEALRAGDCSSEAVETVAATIAQLRSLANRSIDAGTTRWHAPEDEHELIDWLELTKQEYSDWVQKTGIFASDGTPYRLDDDEAIMRGYNAIKQMLIMRVGSQKDHAQAFRDALNK